MATIATAQDGNWTVTSTWSGGVVPAQGDTVTLSHRVTLDVSPAITAFTASGVGALVSSGSQFQVAVGYPRPSFYAKGI